MMIDRNNMGNFLRKIIKAKSFSYLSISKYLHKDINKLFDPISLNHFPGGFL